MVPIMRHRPLRELSSRIRYTAKLKAPKTVILVQRTRDITSSKYIMIVSGGVLVIRFDFNCRQQPLRSTSRLNFGLNRSE